MSDKKQEKESIIGDVHGCAESLKKMLKDISYEMPEKHSISIGSPPENIPKNIPKIKFPDLLNILDGVRRSQQNDAYHSSQYEKMYPKKPK